MSGSVRSRTADSTHLLRQWILFIQRIEKEDRFILFEHYLNGLQLQDVEVVLIKEIENCLWSCISPICRLYLHYLYCIDINNSTGDTMS